MSRADDDNARLAGQGEFSHHQLALAGGFWLASLKRTWFAKQFDNAPQPFLTKLLVAMYLCYREGRLLTKKQAMQIMDATDGRTSSKCIEYAAKRKLLVLAPSIADRRITYLSPTKEALQVLESDLSAFAVDLIEGGKLVQETRFTDEGPYPSWITTLQMDDFMPPRHARQLLEESDDQYETDDSFERERRILQYSETIRIAPTNAAAYFRRAWEYERQNEMQRADADYSKFVHYLPRDPLSWSERGRYLEKWNKPEKALENYAQAIKFFPKNVEFKARYAEMLVKLERFEEAVACLNDAIELRERGNEKSKYPENLYLDRGHCYEQLGRFEEAANDLRRAIEQDESLGMLEVDIDRLLAAAKGSLPMGPTHPKRKIPPGRPGGI